MFKSIKVLTGIFLFAVLIQLCYFIWITTHNISLHKADLIVVFPGEIARITAGQVLASEGYAANLSVVNYTFKDFQEMAKNHKDLMKIRTITGSKSRSTFEDAYTTVQIISQQHYQSVILVTSSYHMPRALFLLKTLLLSSGLNVNVQYSSVEMASDVSSSKAIRLYYNETVKLWGSTIEMLGYQFTHTLLMDSLGFLRFKNFIKTRLLFQT